MSVKKISRPAPVRLLSVAELSELLQIPVQTIYRWSYRGEGPTSIRVGRYLRYDPSDVAEWVEGRKAIS